MQAKKSTEREGKKREEEGKAFSPVMGMNKAGIHAETENKNNSNETHTHTHTHSLSLSLSAEQRINCNVTRVPNSAIRPDFSDGHIAVHSRLTQEHTDTKTCFHD